MCLCVHKLRKYDKRLSCNFRTHHGGGGLNSAPESMFSVQNMNVGDRGKTVICGFESRVHVLSLKYGCLGQRKSSDLWIWVEFTVNILHQDDLKKRVIRITAPWRKGCLGQMPVHTTPNHHPSKNLSSNHPCCKNG